MDIVVRPVKTAPQIKDDLSHHVSRGTFTMGSKTYPCALGEGGLTRSKKEGDLKTPLGKFPLRALYCRYDKLSQPIYTKIPMTALAKNDGWCDDLNDPAYNKFVTLPYGASAESLWREDDLYDVIIVLGHNDDPVESGKGSAIFLHVARTDEGGLDQENYIPPQENYTPTKGCIALKKQDLLEILPLLSLKTTLIVLDS